MPKIHEWTMVSVWSDAAMAEELQRYEKDGWEVFQFFGTVSMEERPIGFRVIMRKEIIVA